MEWSEWVGLGWVRADLDRVSEQLVVTKPKWILRSGPGSRVQGGRGKGAGAGLWQGRAGQGKGLEG